MNISDLPIPNQAKAIIERSGIKELYEPQEEAVTAGLLSGRSLLLCTPTASGKTLLAELASLKVLEEGKQVIYVVPLRALASEKFDEFQRWAELGYKIELQMGDLDAKFLPDKSRFDVLVTTAEKCDSILRSKPGWFHDLGLLIMDEIHLLTTDRGPTYEILITKFREIFPNVQVLGLSATVGNPEEIAEWLGAELVKSSFRPVPLKQEIKTGGISALRGIIEELLKEKSQSLVFVNSRRSAESVAENLGVVVGKFLDEKEKNRLSEISGDILNALSVPTAQCKRLADMVKNGSAFHHAGLVNKQRRLVEEGFKEGFIKVITATPTLAAGVNLPARTVVIRDIKRYSGFGMDYIPVLEYHQMTGRAGRPKYDKEGTSILIATNEDEKKDLFEKYVKGDPENVLSKLGVEPVLRMHVLAAVASRFCRTEEELLNFFSKTLFAHGYGLDNAFKRRIEKVLKQLTDWRLIVGGKTEFSGGGSTDDFSRDDELFVSAAKIVNRREEPDAPLLATPLGNRISELYIDPETAHNFVLALEFAEKNKRTNKLGILEMLGTSVELRPLIRVRRNNEDEVWQRYYEDQNKLFTSILGDDSDYIERYNTALLFDDWINEKTEDFILNKYNLAPGLLRIKIDNADWLLYSASEIVDYLAVKDKSLLKRSIYELRNQIKHGVKEELLPLVAIRNIGRARARKLFNAGIRSREDIRQAGVKKVGTVIGAKVAQNVLSEID